MTIRLYHWVLAIALSLLLHAVFLFKYETTDDLNAAKGLGVGGFEVALSTQVTAAGAEHSGAAETPPNDATDIEKSSDTSLSKTQAEADVPPPEEAPEPQAAQNEPTSEPIPQPDQSPAPVIEEPLEVAEAITPKLIVPPTPKSRPQRLKETPPSPSEPQEIQTPKKIAKSPQQVAEKPVSDQTSTPKKVAKQAAAQTIVSGGTSSQSAPTGDSTDTMSAEGGGKFVGLATPSYISQVREWLERHKTYPKKAKRRRQQGVVTITFAIDKFGKVLKYAITDSSGISSLDKATIQMLEKANPLPPFPISMKGNYLEFDLPVEFSLSH